MARIRGIADHRSATVKNRKGGYTIYPYGIKKMRFKSKSGGVLIQGSKSPENLVAALKKKPSPEEVASRRKAKRQTK